MRCPSCTHENREGAKFCEECAAPLPRRCGSCGATLRASAKFCDECATPVQPAEERARADEAVARKVVTIVFADLVGSTSLHERLDAESVRRFMDRYYRAMERAVEAHRGTVTQLLGDGVKAVFGAPRVAEDDAIRAVRAAVGMQRAFRDLALAELGLVGKTGLRVAVNTGEVVASDKAEIIGDPVNVAARLQEGARDGDVVIGESTRRLVGELVTLAPLGTFTLKGRAETVAAYRVVSLDRPAGVAGTAFVGRDDELRRLRAVYDTAVASRRARLAVILGSPGLGKSRLMAEVARRLGDRATVLTAQCDAAGGATFAPIAKAVRAHLRIEDGASADALRAAIEAAAPGDDAERARIADGIAALLGGAPASPEETFFVVRRLLAAFAAVQPVVLAIDDLHWAESLLLDLTEHLVQWSTDVPLLVLVAARPELREARSSLAAPGGLVAEVVTLTGLDAGAATRLAANVIGADELPAAVAGRVLATSEGNPLFVGELVRMLVHDGALKREGDRWTTGVELARLEMPPTIQALLAARIERLRPEERTVLERAAVVGRQFSRAAVTHLLPREVTDLDARLEALRRSELIEPDTGWFLGEPVLRFHHVLIRDAAYRRVLKNTRAELHARFAGWVESRVGEAVEHDETIGWHLEQAHQHLRELGPIDAQGRVLGERAARYLAAAGRRALARDDLPLAASLLGRALDRLDAADPGRADLALDWCEALLAAGDVGPATGAIDELGRFIDGSERLRAWHTCFAGELAALTDPQALRATADAVSGAAEALASAGDAAGEAKAHFVHALALSRLGKVGACEAALDRALAAARRGRDRRRSNAVLAGAPPAALWGPSPVTRASGRCLDVVRVLRITQGSPAVEAVALRCQGVLEALRGRTEAARRMIASSRRMVEELGITQRLLEADVFAGLIELLEGDSVAAERGLRAAYDGLRAHGLGIDAARAAALLGRALLALGRAAEAETVSHESEALAGDDLQAAIAWRGVRAEALARRGEHAAAIDFARAAVDLAAATDSLLYHADARLALAAVLRAAGRSDEGAAEEARAIELWEAKGATLLAERARREAPRAGQATRAPIARSRSSCRASANAASANLERLGAAFAAGDADAIENLLADRVESVHHPTGATYDRQGLLTTYRSMLKVQHPVFRQELVATLGDSVALNHMFLSATGFVGQTFDVGAFDREEFGLITVDANGRQRWAEFFAADRLGDAVARLYERYAELLPDGPERARAATTARSVATLLGPIDRGLRDSMPFTPDIEFVDHRPLGFAPTQGAEPNLRRLDTMFEVATDITTRVDEVLALRPDALLVHWTHRGTERIGGGPYERPFLMLFAFGADGLASRNELFDSDHEHEALARFDELTAKPAAARLALAPAHAAQGVERRVRANAVTAYTARFDAAIAARNADALPALADEYEVVDHTTGVTYDRDGELSSWCALVRAQDPTARLEPLATLGDSLGLFRVSMSASSFRGGTFDVSAFEREQISLFEVDAGERGRRGELFRVDRLGDAVVRLYERYADLLPDGSERARAAATARSVAELLGPSDPDRYGGALAPDVEFTDHRLLGFGSARGAEAFLRARRAMFEVAEDITFRVDDILSLRFDGFLLRWTTSGTVRASGGTFERCFLLLGVFGTAGLLTHDEYFDADREAEALARFDELTAEPPTARIAATPSRATEKRRRVRANASTALAARFEAAIARRDADAFHALLADEYEDVDHTTGVTYDRDGELSSFRALVRAEDPTCLAEPLATLGDSLALIRCSMSATKFPGGTLDVGAYERELIILQEVDARGRARRTELFATDRLGDAIARLYQRYADLLPDGPARARAAATARSVAGMGGPLDPDRYASTWAPAIEWVDHRVLGTWFARGAEEALHHLRSLLEVSDGITPRIHAILDLRSDALLVHWTNTGTVRAGGGVFESTFLMLWVFGPDGLQIRNEIFDPNREAEALARFDELTGERAMGRFASVPSRVPDRRARRVRPNAATSHMARLDAAMAARDAGALTALVAEDAEVMEHLTNARYDRQGYLASLRFLLRARDPAIVHEPLATLGDSLALFGESVSASGFAGATFDVGAYERERIVLIDVDAEGRSRWAEFFATDRLDEAIARLYERYADLLPDGPARARAAATARSIAVQVGLLDPDRYASTWAPAIESVDHRVLGTWSAQGAEAALQNFRSLVDVSGEITTRIHAILDLRSDALLVHWTNAGTVRSGGGAFERTFLLLRAFGTDGLATRIEYFDADREAEALARFEELTGEPAMGRFASVPSRVADRRARRVRPNAATANAVRVDAAVAARDTDALPTLLAEQVEITDNLTGTTWGRRGTLDTWHMLLTARDPALAHEPLATLGDALALCRVSATASGFAGAKFDVGPYRKEEINLIEVDAHGRRRRGESFALDRLGDAVARLYERYADLLPEGPSRTRALATARAVATIMGPADVDRHGTAIAPDMEFVDRRTLGLGSARGAEAVLRGLRSLIDVSDSTAYRIEDVLALRPDAFLVHSTNFGTDRGSGGAYERSFLMLWVFGADGLATRAEQFDADREAEALARFDELTAEPQAGQLTPEPSRPVAKRSRRVRRNAATANWARADAAFAARDADAFPALLADHVEVVDHTTGATFGREGLLATQRSLLSARDPTWRPEPLATLGESLALGRGLRSASGFADARFDVGAYEREETILIEVDAQGRLRRMEVFAENRLGDAITRLYECYADLLPDGPERIRAAATARSVATMAGPPDLERYGEAFAPGIEAVDHRILGTWSASGAEALIQTFRSLLEVADDIAWRDDDILVLQSDAFLIHRTHVGTHRASGGAYERPFLLLVVFGPDGRPTRIEWFDADRDAEALARFDALTGEPAMGRFASVPSRVADRRAGRVRPNAATAHMVRLDAAIAARDIEAVASLLSERAEAVEHPTGVTYDRQGLLDTWRMLLRARDPAIAHEPLATLGESLALFEESVSASGFAGAKFDVGPYRKEEINLVEVDAQGLRQRGELFALDRLGDAVVRLYERYADLLPDGPARARAAATARSAAAMLGPTYDVARYATAIAPAIEFVDHRSVGIGSARGAEPYLDWLRTFVEVADDIVVRLDDVLELRSDSTLVRFTSSGTDRVGGGAFERHLLAFWVFGSDGLITRYEQFDDDRDAEALARFDALTAEPAAPRFANAMTRSVDRVRNAWAIRDWERIAAEYAPGLRVSDRRRYHRVDLDRSQHLESLRLRFDMSSSRMVLEVVATRGERLGLGRTRWELADRDVGPSETESLWVSEVDEHGDVVTLVVWDPDDLDAAYAELDARYESGEGASYPQTAVSRAFRRAFAARDWDALAALLAPDLVVNDHRILGWETLHGPEAYIEALRSLVDLAPDAQLRIDHVEMSNHGALYVPVWVGTHEGGAFEAPSIFVAEFDAQTRIRRFDQYDIERLDQARARFEELTS